MRVNRVIGVIGRAMAERWIVFFMSAMTPEFIADCEGYTWASGLFILYFSWQSLELASVKGYT